MHAVSNQWFKCGWEDPPYPRADGTAHRILVTAILNGILFSNLEGCSRCLQYVVEFWISEFNGGIGIYNVLVNPGTGTPTCKLIVYHLCNYVGR